jgi:hypothetical protein
VRSGGSVIVAESVIGAASVGAESVIRRLGIGGVGGHGGAPPAARVGHRLSQPPPDAFSGMGNGAQARQHSDRGAASRQAAARPTGGNPAARERAAVTLVVPVPAAACVAVEVGANTGQFHEHAVLRNTDRLQDEMLSFH